MKCINDINFWTGFSVGIIAFELIKGIIAIATLIVIFSMGRT